MSNENELLKLAYTEALNQLRLHPNLIWTRNNFFLVINSGLLFFAINEDYKSLKDSQLLIYIVGMLLSLIWLWVNIASQRLQRQWRGVVTNIEKDLFENSDVEGPFYRASLTANEGKSWLVSITSALIILSVGFCSLWSFFIFVYLRNHFFIKVKELFIEQMLS